VPDARLYLPKVPSATQVDANGYVPLIQKVTRDGDVAADTKSAASTINQLTGCTD
jgi:hypothetical protein